MTNLWKAPRTPALQPVLAFLAFLSLALSWSLGTPLLSAADEPEHVVKAAAAVRGEFSGAQDIEHFVGWQRAYTTPDYLEVTYRLPQSLVQAREAHEPTCYAFHLDVAANCMATANKAAALDAGDTSTSHMDYFPLYYLAVGWPSLILHGDAAIYGMRVASAIISALMLAAAFTTSIRRRGAAALGILAAATPVAVYYGAVVNPSGLEISSAVLAWASLLSIVRAEPGAPGMRRDRTLFAVSAAVLMVVRPLGPIWIAILVAAVLATGSGVRDRLRRTLHSRGVRWTGGLLALSVLAAGIWDLTQNTLGVVPETNPTYTFAKGVYLTTFRTPALLSEMLGTIGWLDVRVPTVTTLFWYGVIAALLLVSFALGNRRERLVLLALTALVILFPIFFDAYSGAAYGLGWQGRYTLPLAVGLPILSAEILVRRLSSTPWGQVPRALATTFGATLAIAYLCQVWWAWRRYADGLVTGHLFPLHAKWSPPIGWAAMLILAAAGCAGLLLLLRHCSLASDGYPDSHAETGAGARDDTGTEEPGTAPSPARPDRVPAPGTVIAT